jgi:hypothetical protein
MSRCLMIFILYVLCCDEIICQSVSISDDINIRSDNGYELLGRYKNNILLYRDKLVESEIVAFDDQMRMRWQKTIEFEDRRPLILDVIGGQDYFSLVYRAKNKNGYIVKISRFDAAATFVDSIIAVTYGIRTFNPSPRCIYSENRKSVLIYNYDQNDRIEASVVDLDNLKVLWTKSIELNENRRIGTRENAIITNKGEAFFIFEKDNNINLFSNESAQFTIYKVGAEENKIIKFSLDEFISYDIEFGYDNLNRNLVAISLASEKNKTKMNGTLLIRNLEMEKIHLSFFHFEEETIYAISGKKTSTKVLNDIKIQELAFRKDGGVVALLEEIRQFSRNMNNMGVRPYAFNDPVGGRITIDYYHEALLAASFNPDGSRHWEKVMLKKQFSQDDDGVFSSYGLLKTPAGLRLLFNDEIKNETTTSEYQLTGAGLVDRHSLFNTSNQNIQLRFRDALQIGSDEILIPSEYRSHLRLVRIKF